MLVMVRGRWSSGGRGGCAAMTDLHDSPATPLIVYLRGNKE